MAVTLNHSTSTATYAAATTTFASQAASANAAPTFASVSNCTQLAGVGEQFAKAMAAATSGGKFDLAAVQTAYQNLANAAPSAIRSDVQVIASALSSYASALSKAGFRIGQAPSATQIAGLEQAAKSVDTAKLRSASRAIESWAAQNCR